MMGCIVITIVHLDVSFAPSNGWARSRRHDKARVAGQTAPRIVPPTRKPTWAILPNHLIPLREETLVVISSHPKAY